eukprot:11448451-Ditylum_brightwellii.AAC.1
MLWELYVAVTRAKRRVVILVKRTSDTMKKFFSSLDYDLDFYPDTKKLLSEFNVCTSKEEWLHRADGLFEEERFLLASECYEKADSPAFAAWARGKDFAKDWNKTKAKREFIQASELFYSLCDFKNTLNIASETLGVVSWEDKECDFIRETILKVSEEKHPTYLDHTVRRKIGIFRDKWDRISLDDIEEEAKV